ncbi:MAG: alpha/beta hydrolase [Patescibacteria group bacterium]|nr:alpha/beta hydrolase [Patescibacteria group bacterium]
MKRALLLYGFWGWPARRGNWFRDEKVLLEKLGYGVTMPLPKSPSSYFPSNRRWQTTIHSFTPDNGSVLVGFSLGGKAILDYLNKAGTNIDTLVLLATPIETIAKKDASSKFQPKISQIIFNILGYKRQSYDWSKIKRSARQIICIYKRDDVRVPLSHGIRLAKELSAQLVILEGKDHMWDVDLDKINNVL